MSSSPVPSELADDDATLARRIVADDEAAFELLMRRHNKGLYRVARAILKDDADAQDVVQEAYLAAFRHHMTDFRANAKLPIWLEPHRPSKRRLGRVLEVSQVPPRAGRRSIDNLPAGRFTNPKR
jgi:hypothetical protein